MTGPGAGGAVPVIPGEIVYGNGPVTINQGRPVLTVMVVNTGDRPVQVGSHYHFAEANPALDFDRLAGWGYRLAARCGSSRGSPGRSIWCPWAVGGSCRDCAASAAAPWIGTGARSDHNGPPALRRTVRADHG